MTRVSRRQVLRGAGVALALPWLESLTPRRARAQAAALPPRKRYISMFYPNGAVPYYWPAAAGAGDAWSLPSVLEPLAPLKSKLFMLGNVANTSPFNGHVEPSHGNLCAATWTCVRANGLMNTASGISVDQAIAKTVGGATPLSSLQVGLSTLDSYSDGNPPQHSRSISWSDPQTPLYKIISPQAVFDRLVGPNAAGSNTATFDPAAERRRRLRKSSLDYLTETTASLQTRLGVGDRVRLDRFLTSVRALELRIAAPAAQMSCATLPRPTEVYAVGQSASIAFDNTKYGGDKPAADYDRGVHANLMIDLVVMALQCDMTRVASFMLDDERSDFVYNFLPGRTFTATTSTPATFSVPGYHGLQHASDYNDAFLTIVHWNMQKLARLAGKLNAITEEGGRSILDNSVIAIASSMHGSNHDNSDLPLLLVGGGGGVLKQNVYQRWTTETPAQLADVHFTLMRQVYGCPDASFGRGIGAFLDAGTKILPELLA
jgi:Protein of unknown function (DUF1552)